MTLYLEGEIFGKLTVVRRDGRDKRGTPQWECDCECGETIHVITNNLTGGHTTNCGCLTSELKSKHITKHGKVGERLYNIWTTLKQRCLNKNSKKYKNYGGRGIMICEEWLDWTHGVENFYKWAMENGYTDELTLDREDVNGNYEPSNCRWVTQKVQQNNRRDNLLVTINGITKTAAMWETEYNLRQGLIGNRVRRLGWTGEKLLEQPTEANKKSGIKGITWNKSDQYWRVRKSINGKMTTLGRRKDLNEAIKILEEYNKNNT